ncbi:MAG TPA: DUF72 domain-containing protein [Xanthomonadaceae bacterium]|nr:DUF72 domain-containing protein [Xanthomonadaceae bacterium]
MKQSGRIRVGIGGWVYAPWRNNFYPHKLAQKRELEYASRRVTAIEVNGTWYGAQKPESYARWRDETPDDFMFSAKAPQRITMSRTLAKSGGAIEDFLGGISTLGPKLGPIVWQFEKGLKVDRGEFTEFLSLLPKQIAELKLRHVLDVRDTGLVDADYLALVRQHSMATVFTDSKDYPSFADLSADFVYARLMRSRTEIAAGYPDNELDQWLNRTHAWSQGSDPADLPYLSPMQPDAGKRDVFVFFISSAKERNPAAAMALLHKLGAT